MTLEALTDALVAGYDPERIILFRSGARGTRHEDSDFDLLTPDEMLLLYRNGARRWFVARR